MLGVQTAQPYGSDLPRSVTAGEGGRGFSGVCFPCFSSLSLPSISSLDYERALSGEREMLWQRQAHTRRAGGWEQRVSWQLRELSFSTPGTGCTHGLSEPWPQPALDGQSQASAHADLNRVPALAFLVCARSYWRSLVIQPALPLPKEIFSFCPVHPMISLTG